MTNPYYNRVYDYTPYSPSRAETFRDEFEAIEHGFDLIGETLGQIAGTSGVNIGFTAGDLTRDMLTENAAQRANTLLGFDGGGQTVLHTPADLDGFAGAHVLDAAGHGRTALPTHGFMPVYAGGGTGGPVDAQADAFATCATAFVVGIESTASLRIQGPGFRRVVNHGLQVGAMYFLSNGAPGAITTTQPTSDWAQPVCEVWDASTLLLMAPVPITP